MVSSITADTEIRGEQADAARGGLRGRLLRDWPEKAAVLMGSAAVAVQASRLGRWIVDDAGITFAYARSVATGHGPVQQPGATPVEGYSDPSWLALLVLGRWLGLFDHGSWFGTSDLVLYPKLLAMLCVVGMLVAVNLAARVVLPRRAWAVTALVGVLFAANMSLIIWCFSGLENALYGLTVVTMASLMLRAGVAGTLRTHRTAVLVGLLALLAALTRPDGLMYAAAFPLTVIALSSWAQWRATITNCLISTATFALPFGVFLLWRHAEFGQWVSNTAIAKSQGLPSVTRLSHTQNLLTYIGWPAVLVFTACVGVACGLSASFRRALAPVVILLGLALLAFSVLVPDWMVLDRFATPVWVLGSLALALSAVSVWEALRGRSRALAAAGLAAALAFGLAADEPTTRTFIAAPTVPLCEVAAIDGISFNQYASVLAITDGSLLTPDLGGTLLTSDLRVYDMTGLTEPHIARDYRNGDMAGLREYVFTTVRPTFIHSVGWWESETGLSPQVLLANGYVALDAHGGTSGNWVRSADVANPSLLARARALTASTVEPELARVAAEPRGGCGARLSPGATEIPS